MNKSPDVEWATWLSSSKSRAFFNVPPANIFKIVCGLIPMIRTEMGSSELHTSILSDFTVKFTHPKIVCNGLMADLRPVIYQRLIGN